MARLRADKQELSESLTQSKQEQARLRERSADGLAPEQLKALLGDDEPAQLHEDDLALALRASNDKLAADRATLDAKLDSLAQRNLELEASNAQAQQLAAKQSAALTEEVARLRADKQELLSESLTQSKQEQARLRERSADGLAPAQLKALLGDD